MLLLGRQAVLYLSERQDRCSRPPERGHAVPLDRVWRARRQGSNPGVAFVGRARALSRLLRDRRGGRSAAGRGWCWSAGEAGIGKTTLIGEAAARSGLAVGWGTCADAERAPAFWAWTTALRGLLAAVGPASPRR